MSRAPGQVDTKPRYELTAPVSQPDTIKNGGIMISQDTIQQYLDGQKAQTVAILNFFKDLTAAIVPVVMQALQVKERELDTKVRVAELKVEEERIRSESISHLHQPAKSAMDAVRNAAKGKGKSKATVLGL